MRKVLVMTCALLLVMCAQFPAQSTRDAEGFKLFWMKFKSAVTKNDKTAVASMTKLPFLYESVERDRAGFIKIYAELFDARVRKCFGVAKTMKEGDVYEVFCAGRIFYFGKVDGDFKFTEFAVDY